MADLDIGFHWVAHKNVHLIIIKYQAFMYSLSLEINGINKAHEAFIFKMHQKVENYSLL